MTQPRTGSTAAAGEEQQSDDDDPNDVIVEKIAKTVVHTFTSKNVRAARSAPPHYYPMSLAVKRFSLSVGKGRAYKNKKRQGRRLCLFGYY